jgi:hypothetical protein
MKLLPPLLILLFSLPVFPWGFVGHKTIALIAESYLDSTVRTKIAIILQGESMEEVATWADEYKRSHPNTGPWHYINLPARINVSASDLSKYRVSNGRYPKDNILDQIKKNIAELKSDNVSLYQKQNDLKFLIHFIGDLHQPLHIADDRDRGGNQKEVRFFSPSSRSHQGRALHLHALWDNLIEARTSDYPENLAAAFERDITPFKIRTWDSGSLEDWTMESYAVAKNFIYSSLPPGPTPDKVIYPLPLGYYSVMRPLCNQQIEKAGVRLAFILESIFGE